MNRTVAAVLIVASGVLVVTVAIFAVRSWWGEADDDGSPGPLDPPLEVQTADPPGPGAVPVAQREVELYFPGQGGRLYAESHKIADTDEVLEQVREIVQAVLAGPSSSYLRAPLPAGTALRGVDWKDDGIVYLDFQSPEYPSPPPSGSNREMLMVYSVVDSVGLNLPEVKGVALLWNGEQRVTFAGHVDTTQPLSPDTSLLRRSR